MPLNASKALDRSPMDFEKNLDFYWNSLSWHRAYLRHIHFFRNYGRDESAQEQASQILTNLCSLLSFMANDVYVPEPAKESPGAFQCYSGGGINNLLFVNDANIHIHDRMYNNPILRSYVIGKSCVICAMFRTMKRLVRAVEVLPILGNPANWEKKLSGNAREAFFGYLIRSLINNAEAFGMTAKELAETKRCRDFLGTLIEMSKGKADSPERMYSSGAPFNSSAANSPSETVVPSSSDAGKKSGAFKQNAGKADA